MLGNPDFPTKYLPDGGNLYRHQIKTFLIEIICMRETSQPNVHCLGLTKKV